MPGGTFHNGDFRVAVSISRVSIILMTGIIGIILFGVFIYAMFHNPGGGGGGHDDKKSGKDKH